MNKIESGRYSGRYDGQAHLVMILVSYSTGGVQRRQLVGVSGKIVCNEMPSRGFYGILSSTLYLTAPVKVGMNRYLLGGSCVACGGHDAL